LSLQNLNQGDLCDFVTQIYKLPAMLKNKMILKKKYINRHEILRTLLVRRKDNESPNNLDERDIALNWTKLVEKSNLSETEIIQQIYYLKNENEIVETEFDEYNFYYHISRTGMVSYYDKKYLNQRKKEFADNIYDVLKILSTAILLIFAIITFRNNWIISNKNESEIEILKKEVLKLKNQIETEKGAHKHSR